MYVFRKSWWITESKRCRWTISNSTSRSRLPLSTWISHKKLLIDAIRIHLPKHSRVIAGLHILLIKMTSMNFVGKRSKETLALGKHQSTNRTERWERMATNFVRKTHNLWWTRSWAICKKSSRMRLISTNIVATRQTNRNMTKTSLWTQ